MLMALGIPARTGAAPGTDGGHYVQQEHGQDHCGQAQVFTHSFVPSFTHILSDPY